jgi:hypothetical protein
MTQGFLAVAISFAIFSLLNGCTQTGDGLQNNEQTKIYIEDRKLAGWSIMSEQERRDLRQKMLSMKSYEECSNYVEHHFQMMLERAREIGTTRPINRTDICHRMKSAGMFR